MATSKFPSVELMHLHRDIGGILVSHRSVIYTGHPIPVQRPASGWVTAEIPCGTCGMGIDIRVAAVNLTRRLQRVRTAVVFLVLVATLFLWYLFIRYAVIPVVQATVGMGGPALAPGLISGGLLGLTLIPLLQAIRARLREDGVRWSLDAVHWSVRRKEPHGLARTSPRWLNLSQASTVTRRSTDQES